MSKMFQTIANSATSNSSQFPVNQNIRPFTNSSPSRTYADGYNRIVIRDMIVDMRIGAYESERAHPQPVCVNLVASVDMPANPERDIPDGSMSYDEIITEIQFLATGNDTLMLETLAEKISSFCLSDPKVQDVSVRLEKLAAVQNTGGIGIEIMRSRAA